MTVFVTAGIGDGRLPRIGWQTLTGTVTASTAATGYEASRAVAQETYDGWKPTALPARWEIQLADLEQCNYMGIAAHELAGYTIVPQRWTGAAWEDMAAAQVVPDNGAIFWLFPTYERARYSLLISAGPGLPVVGHIRFGVAMVVPRLATYTGDPLDEGEQVSLRFNQSETGELLGTIVEGNGLAFTVQIDHLSEEFRQGEWRAFKRYAERGGTFFIAPKPEDYSGEVAYAWTRRAAVTRTVPNSVASGSVTLECTGYAKP
jgi:hypothetical protein